MQHIQRSKFLFSNRGALPHWLRRGKVSRKIDGNSDGKWVTRCGWKNVSGPIHL